MTLAFSPILASTVETDLQDVGRRTNMKICPVCGFELAPNMYFCPLCSNQKIVDEVEAEVSSGDTIRTGDEGLSSEANNSESVGQEQGPDGGL
jgi:hypothetical protein